MAKVLTEKPQFIVKEGKPTGVILNIHDYKELLERIEDIDDLAELRRLRKKPLKFRPFEEFLKEQKNV